MLRFLEPTVVPEDLYGVNSLLTLPVSSHLDIQSRTVPCRELLDFLQRNIVIAVGVVAGILVTTVVLLLMLTMHARRKQAL